MTRAHAIALVLASSLVVGGSRPLAAQGRASRTVVVPEPLMAIARNDLSFGTVLSGIPASVDVLDPRRAGVFEIRGPSEATVRVEFRLPDALRSDRGGILPLRFAARDGFATNTMDRPQLGTYFDPATPLVGSLGSDGRLYVRLGGTALPANPQLGGTYFATIFLTVYDLGS